MAFRKISAATVDELLRALNGMVVSKKDLTLRGQDNRPNPDTTAGHNLFKHPVNGLTLIFTVPAVTITFSDDLDWKEIMTEIEAAAPGIGHLLKTNPNGGSVLAFWDDTAPVTMLHTGTANPYFGFPTGAADPDLVQTAVPAADVYAIQNDPLSKQWYAIIDD